MTYPSNVTRAGAVFLAALLLVTLAAAAYQTDISGPAGSGSFGAAIYVLPNGNLVVSDPGYDAPGAADVGAVYLYDGSSGEMISTLTGGTAGDQVGSGGVWLLAGGNFVVASPYWDQGAALDASAAEESSEIVEAIIVDAGAAGESSEVVEAIIVDAGAVTWGSAVSGVSGVVSAANSLVGSTSDDLVGFGSSAVLQLPNGSYLVRSPTWDYGDQVDAGAVTWGSGTSGVNGEISAANSLIGGSNGDHVGGDGSVVILANGSYLVISPDWDNGAAVDSGAATWGSETSGVHGLISSANSLIGGTAYDQVGLLDPVPLPGGNYLVPTPSWDNGSVVDAGAVTWGSGASGVAGILSPANSLVGSSASDRIGDLERVTVLLNGNYLVSSPLWDNGSAVDAGAVTWGSAASGVTGAISAANSLVGSSPNDMIGFPHTVYRLLNGSAVVTSYLWDSGAIADAGAVTWMDGSAGISGPVSAANSLVGSTANDRVGSGRITWFSSDNVVVRSPSWDRGAIVDAGAVTYVNGTTGITGTVSVTNSLVGSSAGDNVGLGGEWEVAGTGLVVITPSWDNGVVVDAGAITWVSTAGGVAGEISTANSLVGGAAGDRVGSGGLLLLSNGSYVVHSPEWDNGNTIDAGAFTWADGAAGISGIVSPANSLVGSAPGDLGGNFPMLELANGNFVIRAPSWDNGAIADAGAATWGSSTTGISGEVSGLNSLVGLTSGDRIGAAVWALANGNYVVTSPEWDNGLAADAGAVTWASGSSGITGLVSPANSLVGGSAGDSIGEFLTELYNGSYVVRSPGWDNGAAVDAGAITWGSGATGVIGVVSAANSLVGSHTSDLVGFYPIERLSNVANGSFVVGSPDWDNGAVLDAGAATWVNGQTGRAGVISAANSLVGSSEGDAVGGFIHGLPGGNFLVLSPEWDNGAAVDAGAVTWGSGATGVSGVVSTANSLVGSSTGDGLGNYADIGGSDQGDYLLLSPGWDNGLLLDAGAATLGDGAGGSTIGTIQAGNSVIGTVSGGGAVMNFNYDHTNHQFIIGRPAENVVTLYLQTQLGYLVRLPLIVRE